MHERLDRIGARWSTAVATAVLTALLGGATAAAATVAG